jgi:cell division protein FtsB
MAWNFRSLRFLRRRMTIAAPRMSVRTHVPWYLRAVFWIVVLSVSIAGAAWVYDAGRKIAGFDSTEVQQELATLRTRTAHLTEENAHLKASQNSADSNIAIERTTQKRMAEQVHTLESENARLKEDVALFEGMVSTDRKEGNFAINGFKVEVDGQMLKYRMLLTRGARTGSIMGGNQEPEFAGKLVFEVTPAPAADGTNGAMIRLPAADDPAGQATQVKFRYFQRAEGSLTLPPGVRPKQVLVRLLQGTALKASETAVPADAKS